MWQLRVLSGNSAGKTFPLKLGSNKVGRAPGCDVTISHNSISKEHAQIDVTGDKIIITDLRSRNGTFVNGVQIRSQKIQPGDKVALFDLIIEIVPVGTNVRPFKRSQKVKSGQAYERAIEAYQGSAAASINPQHDPGATPQAQPANSAEFIKRYFEDVVMPGVYRLAEWMEFKVIVIVFCLINVVGATMLSTIPLTQILTARIAGESMQRAKSLAAALAESNRGAVQQGLMTGLNTNILQGESGVDEAYIINMEGRILAPVSRAQEIPNQPFVHEVRKSGNEGAKQISSTKVVALKPVIGVNSQTGLQAPLAFSVVVYDMSRFAVDDGETFGLFVRSLVIALIIGSVIFYLLFRLVLRPITLMNAQVSDSLRTGQGQIFFKFNFPELQELIANVNSALSRSSGPATPENVNNYEYDRSGEVTGILNLVGFAAMAIRPEDQRVIGANSHFLEQIARGANWNQITLSEVLDSALRQNITSVMERAQSATEQIATDTIDVAGINYDVQGQAVYGTKAVAYIVIVFIPKAGG